MHLLDSWILALSAVFAAPALNLGLIARLDAQTAQEQTCLAAVVDLDRHLRDDYVGFPNDIARFRIAEYEAASEEAHREAAAVEDDALACQRVLQEFAAVLRDGHVFVLARPQLSAADSARYAEQARTIPDFEARLDESTAQPSPLVGRWYAADGLRTAIVPDPDRPGAFAAVWVEGPEPGWTRGQVKAEFTPRPDGSWDVIHYGGAHEPSRVHVHFSDAMGGGMVRRSGTLLHLPPWTWGRIDAAGAGGTLDAVDPRAPTIRPLGREAIVVSVPSHGGQHAGRLAELVEEWTTSLDSTRLLVIDLRGNEGGGSQTTNVLLPWIPAETPDDTPAPIPAVRSSPLNIRIFERLEPEGWIPEGLAERMRAAPGALVPFHDPDSPPPSTPPDATRGTRSGDRPVAVLVDGGAVSAAEAFLTTMDDAPGVTFFGAPSGGTIDYQSVRMHRFGPREWGLLVGLPLFAGDIGLPEGGFNRTGIGVDVPLDPDDRPFIRILEWYGLGGP